MPQAEEVASTVFEAAADMVTGGDTAGLSALLDRHPELVRARSRQPHRATLLHYAAANGVEDHRQMVPPNAVEIAGLMAPLVRAWASGGGNLNGCGDDGLPMTYAFLFRNVEAAVTLAGCGARVDNAATAAGLDPNRTIHHGMTALHEACLGGHLQIVKLLVEAGGDPGAVEEQHQSTPAGWALYAGHGHVAAYLAEVAGLPGGKASP